MMTGYGMVQDQNLEKQIEKQMGCMAGFLQIFDRNQILTAKKIYSPKRLPPSKVVDSGQVSDKSAASSPLISRELGKPQATLSPPEHLMKPTMPDLLPPKSPLPLSIFELKDGSKSSWKFCKEAPRLSLDSRATLDGKGSLHPREIRTNSSILNAGSRGDNGDDNQRRSPSVIARLMGLEPLPDSNTPEPVKNVELRRSASESRVSRDLFHYRLVDNSNSSSSLQSKLPNSIAQDANAFHENTCSFSYARPVDHVDLYAYKSAKSAKSVTPKQALNRGIVSSPWKSPQYRKSYFDAADVFPEPKQAVSIYGDIEKRLKLRGIDEPSKDLETLKQILEALQLKGLLHSNYRPSEQRNFVYDRNMWPHDESPIVVMRPSKSPVNRGMGNESPPSRYGVRRSSNNLVGEYLPSPSQRRERPAVDRTIRSPSRAGNSSSPSRSDTNAKRSNNSIAKPKPLNVETQRSMENRRVSQVVQSPKFSSRRNGSSQDPKAMRHKRSTGEIYHREITTVVVTEDESSSISESTISTCSHTDTERSKMEEHREGKSLLERCDKLLHSIAEMTATEMQPSPVSVLDSSFYKDESSSSSPSPVMKRSIDFKDNEESDLDEETWSCIFRPVESKLEDTHTDCDLVYISEILLVSHYLPQDCDVFSILEKQQSLKGKDTSKVSTLQRKLIFDVILEILERNRHLPPWKAFSWTDSRTIKSSVRLIWSEFLRIRERDSSDDLFEIIGGVLKKDLAGDAMNGWGDCPVELCEAVLDIERLIFKDLIGETIRDLAAFACKSKVSYSLASRRKLIF